MGPDLLNWIVQPPMFDLNDYCYFARVDTDPGYVFVSAKSKFKTIDDVVAEGKKRTLNVGTSRLAHPASIGCLALGEHTGAKFNLIPLFGGKNTVAGFVTGDMHLSVLTSGTVAAAGTMVRTLLIFNDKQCARRGFEQRPDHMRPLRHQAAAPAVSARQSPFGPRWRISTRTA